MPIDLEGEYGTKLAELATHAVTNPTPEENAVHARLAGIDGTGNAALVSRVKQGTNKYDGFALVFTHDTKSQEFEWLQFITRQLVGDHGAIKGSLLLKVNTVAYELVDSADEITDYSLATGPKPANWDTCWKVDGGGTKPFFRDSYEYAMSAEKSLSAILDFPASVTSKGKPLERDRASYIDLPLDKVVDMKGKLDEQTGNGIARAYFSDYLVKKHQDKYHILARFDFNLTWNPAKGATKKDFTLHSVKTTMTTELLECHKAALLHETTTKTRPFKSFYEKIH
ncbi:hypothetical protein TWF694_010368 [Orbilia ellipsospora]|uniref:Uncharacterized protein n=1 Tax=Orbilia ellipsospora TaxID=2528407 RepID=A0AAV9XFY2_9PEZI